MLELKGHGDTVTGLSLSPDGSRLLSNSMDSTLKAWDVAPFSPSERCVATFEGHSHDFHKNLLRCSWFFAVHESNFSDLRAVEATPARQRGGVGAFYAIDATPARWRGDAGCSPLDGAGRAASSPRNDPTHWLISTQAHTATNSCGSRASGPRRSPHIFRKG